jgi:hypothetical protein
LDTVRLAQHGHQTLTTWLLSVKIASSGFWTGKSELPQFEFKPSLLTFELFEYRQGQPILEFPSN